MNRENWPRRFAITFLLWLLATPVWAGPLFTDPTGDALGIHDITSLNTRIVGGKLFFDITFKESVTDPSLGGPRDLFGFLDLDVDQSVSTGINSPDVDFLAARGGIGPATGLGVDYYIDLSSILLSTLPEAYLLRAIDRNQVGVASVEFHSAPADNTVTLGVSLADLGSATGQLSFGLLAADANGFSDELTGFIDPVVVPEPATLLGAGLGLASITLWYGSKRRRKVA